MSSSNCLSTLLSLGLPRLASQRALAALGADADSAAAAALLTHHVINDQVMMNQQIDLGRTLYLSLNEPTNVLLKFECSHEAFENVLQVFRTHLEELVPAELKNWIQGVLEKLRIVAELKNVEIMGEEELIVKDLRVVQLFSKENRPEKDETIKTFKVARRFRSRDTSELDLKRDEIVLIHPDDWYDSAHLILATKLLSRQKGLVSRTVLVPIPTEQTWTLHLTRQFRSSFQGKRRLYVVRHGERIDHIFSDWVPYCFDARNCYMAKDVNMPPSVPERANIVDFNYDTPLTLMGERQATMLGLALNEARVKLKFVFASPSLRCVQTAQNIVDELGVKNAIRIEPGLFEWLEWYSGNGLPTWMSAEELRSNGYSVDLNYKPFLSPDELANTLHNVGSESAENFYARIAFVVQCILQSTENEDDPNDVMLVGHSASLDACTRDLVGGQTRSENAMMQILRRVPYCGLCVAEKMEGEWSLVEPPVPPLTHTSCNRFDWRVLVQDK